jgi:hypothetical protein
LLIVSDFADAMSLKMSLASARFVDAVADAYIEVDVASDDE